MEVRSRAGGRKKRKKSLKNLWALGTGKTWKALREFPDRLRRMAKEVEQINASPLFAPARYINVKTTRAGFVRTGLEQLPAIMSFYANGLEMHIARLPKDWGQHFSASRQGYPPVLLYLSQIVKLFTGRWHDAKVADLLNAAAIALDERCEFDFLTIAQARSRFKKKQKT
jgi:hypothetical protein